MKQVVIFDLDGTLVRTIGDITGALNYALTECGHPALTEPQVEAIVGYSTEYMFQHAVPADAYEDWKKLGALFDRYYRQHSCDVSRPYDGMMTALTRLKAAGAKLGVISNKPHAHTLIVMEKLFPCNMFSLILGRMDKFALKPAADALHFGLEQLGGTAENAVYVGDSEVDVLFAKNAGIPCLSVSWGYRSRKQLLEAGATQIIDDPGELCDLLL